MRKITDIEAERRSARITKAELCKTARVNVATYRRLEKGDNMPNLRTLEKLTAAIDALRAQRIAELGMGAAQ
jgi:transcriptional regulator with XRE-family HTH domain